MHRIKGMITALTFVILCGSLLGCQDLDQNERHEIRVFAAKSLNRPLNDIIEGFEMENPQVKIIANYDGSGALLTQIEEGADCQVFFSADQSQMDTLVKEGRIYEDTRVNVVRNQLCVVTYKGSNTKVSGLSDMDKASSLAIAGGSVPAGKYTRQALINMGRLLANKEASSVTTKEISEAYGYVTINECPNVGAVASAVSQGANEVGTVYYSDTFGYESSLEILEVVKKDLTGEILYPAAVMKGIDSEDYELSKAFADYLKSDAAKKIFEEYHFDTNVN